MMSPKDKLVEILRKEITDLPLDDQKVLLEEKQNKGQLGKLSKVEISYIPIGSLILKADKATMSLFDEHSKAAEKYRRQCDYIIITEYKKVKYFLYLEMKSATRSKGYIQQLWCSRSLMEYLNFAITNLDGASVAFNQYQHRFAKLASIPLDKDTTNPRDNFKAQNFKNDKPGNSCVYFCNNGDSIRLKDLLQ